jgi:hypothetical protein
LRRCWPREDDDVAAGESNMAFMNSAVDGLRSRSSLGSLFLLEDL